MHVIESFKEFMNNHTALEIIRQDIRYENLLKNQIHKF